MALSELNGSMLGSHFEWLLRHAEYDRNGVLKCKKTGGHIDSRVAYRARLKTAGTNAPYVPDHTLGDGAGKSLTFVTFWCRSCDDVPLVPQRIHRRHVVMIKAGIPAT